MAYTVQFNVDVEGTTIPGEQRREETFRSWAAVKNALSAYGVKIWFLDAPTPGKWHHFLPAGGGGVQRYLCCGVRVYRS